MLFHCFPNSHTDNLNFAAVNTDELLPTLDEIVQHDSRKIKKTNKTKKRAMRYGAISVRAAAILPCFGQVVLWGAALCRVPGSGCRFNARTCVVCMRVCEPVWCVWECGGVYESVHRCTHPFSWRAPPLWAGGLTLLTQNKPHSPLPALSGYAMIFHMLRSYTNCILET